MIKFIDAKLDLSIQVHPGDELARKRHNSFGKNEMWYVVSADKGAKLISGFSEQITPKEYKERVYNGTFAEVLQTCDVKPGDVFYVPAGRVHGMVPVLLLLKFSRLRISLIVFRLQSERQRG